MVRSQWMSFYYYYLRVLGRSALVRHLQEKEQMLPLWEGHPDELSYQLSIIAIKKVLLEDLPEEGMFANQ